MYKMFYKKVETFLPFFNQLYLRQKYNKSLKVFDQILNYTLPLFDLYIKKKNHLIFFICLFGVTYFFFL